MRLNDYELNNLDYLAAIKKDKRTYIQYYISLLKQKQKIIFTFYTSDDYNSKFVKISLFFFSFSFYYIINALFFNDSTMHKIYEDKGNFDFIYQIPQILYSTIISSIINMIIIFLSLTEKDIIALKKSTKDFKLKKRKFMKSFKNKIIVFYLLIFLFLFLFWYYISCFCAIYKNTQIHLLKDTLISYTLSQIYPLGLCLLPGLFRIPALNAKNHNKQILYKISKIIQLI